MTKFQQMKNFVLKHKEALTVAVLAVLAIEAQHKSIKQMNKFLEEKDLFEEYYSTQE